MSTYCLEDKPPPRRASYLLLLLLLNIHLLLLLSYLLPYECLCPAVDRDTTQLSVAQTSKQLERLTEFWP